MNYGDGWYGGVYVAAMYSLSFWSDDIPFIVSEALRTIPEQSQFYQCIHDVIGWYGKFPDDWKMTWFEVQKKWSSDIGCPDGVFRPFDIDAKINAAYIVIGMLYGGGDFGKTLEISTRCGQDSDCNPASAGGIIGTILGYDAIPEFWKARLDRVEDMDFKYTTISLNDTYEMSYNHALEMINRNGGEELEQEVRISAEKPVAVKYERSFEGHFPVGIIDIPWETRSLVPDGQKEYSFDFTGKGFVLRGGAGKDQGVTQDSDLHLDVFVDGTLLEEALIPTSFQARRHELTWKYNLENGDHAVRVVWKDPRQGYRIDLNNIIIYGPEPAG
jgi:ADP-ribosylglycohydrolase